MWELAWSEKEKHWFYFNRRSGDSSWQRPQGCDLVAPSDSPRRRATGALLEEDLPEGWEIGYDHMYESNYYYNPRSSERQWRKPGSLELDVDAANAAAAAAVSAAKVVDGASSPSSRRGPLGILAGLVLPVMSRTGSRASSSAGSRKSSKSSPFSTPRSSQLDAVEAAELALRGLNNNEWDAESFVVRLGNVRRTGEKHLVKRVLAEVAASNYRFRRRWYVPGTFAVPHGRCEAHRVSGLGKSPVISFSTMTTVDALLHFSRILGRKVCGLNFANGQHPGGGYRGGAMAQEEDICRRVPALYPSLAQAKRQGCFPFGPSTCASADRPQKYSDVLFTKPLAVGRSCEGTGFELLDPEEQGTVSLVSAAAPNVRFANEVYDLGLMYDTVRTIFKAPALEDPETDTLVLGAWGCGAFGCNPLEVAGLFVRALKDPSLAQLYEHIHFAIPEFDSNDQNAAIFRSCFQAACVPFEDLTL